MRLKILAAITGLLFTSSCNFFNLLAPLESIDTDIERLSRAEACLDQKDTECAREQCEALSIAYKDQQNKCLVAIILEEEEVTMATFMSSIGKGGNGGELITRMANRMAEIGATQQKRKAVAEAYKHVVNIGDAQLRGLTRFLVSFALLGVMFGEITGSDNILNKADIFSGYTTTCESSLSCSMNNNNIVDATGTVPNLNNGDDDFGGSLSLDMIYSAVVGLSTGLGTGELGASGKFGGGISSISSTLTNNQPTNAATSDVFMSILGNDGLGE